jgi:hypothetical protein
VIMAVKIQNGRYQIMNFSNSCFISLANVEVYHGVESRSDVTELNTTGLFHFGLMLFQPYRSLQMLLVWLVSAFMFLFLSDGYKLVECLFLKSWCGLPGFKRLGNSFCVWEVI